MMPTFQIFGKTIAMYGLMIMIGLIVGVAIALLRSKKNNLLAEDILFASCFGGIGLLIGAKLLYILTILPKLISYRQILFDNPYLLAGIIKGGFVFYGGLIGALVGYFIYCKKFKINTVQMLDLIAPSIPIIHAFGRLGCNFAGCCYGIPYNGPGHVIFHRSLVAPGDIALFPTQLAESVLNFIAGILLLLYSTKAKKTGNVLGVYIIYYSVMRFLIEFLRGDVSRGILLQISTSQWISLALLPIGIWLITGFKPFKHSTGQ